MAPIRRCHVCGTHFRPGPERRHGRIRCPDPTSVTLPTTAFVCAGCRPDVVDLTRHWERRDDGDACSFCAEPADETGAVHLASIVDDRVVSRGDYRLCPDCEEVFETFLADLHTELDFPSTWAYVPTASGAVFEHDDGEMRVEASEPTDPRVRLRLLVDADPVVEAAIDGLPRERAREFVAAFEAFYDDGDDPRRLGVAAVEGNPGLRLASE